MHIVSAANFPLFCQNSARKCFILPAECSAQKSLILLEILLAEFIQAYCPVVRALALRFGNPVFKTGSDQSLNLILVVDGLNYRLIANLFTSGQ